MSEVTFQWAPISTLNSPPQKGTHLTSRDWAPYTSLIVALREQGKTTNEILGLLHGIGFMAHGETLKKLLARLAPKHSSKHRVPYDSRKMAGMRGRRTKSDRKLRGSGAKRQGIEVGTVPNRSSVKHINSIHERNCNGREIGDDVGCLGSVVVPDMELSGYIGIPSADFGPAKLTVLSMETAGIDEFTTALQNKVLQPKVIQEPLCDDVYTSPPGLSTVACALNRVNDGGQTPQNALTRDADQATLEIVNEDNINEQIEELLPEVMFEMYISDERDSSDKLSAGMDILSLGDNRTSVGEVSSRIAELLGVQIGTTSRKDTRVRAINHRKDYVTKPLTTLQNDGFHRRNQQKKYYPEEDISAVLMKMVEDIVVTQRAAAAGENLVDLPERQDSRSVYEGNKELNDLSGQTPPHLDFETYLEISAGKHNEGYFRLDDDAIRQRARGTSYYEQVEPIQQKQGLGRGRYPLRVCWEKLIQRASDIDKWWNDSEHTTFFERQLGLTEDGAAKELILRILDHFRNYTLMVERCQRIGALKSLQQAWSLYALILQRRDEDEYGWLRPFFLDALARLLFLSGHQRQGLEVISEALSLFSEFEHVVCSRVRIVLTIAAHVLQSGSCFDSVYAPLELLQNVLDMLPLTPRDRVESSHMGMTLVALANLAGYFGLEDHSARFNKTFFGKINHRTRFRASDTISLFDSLADFTSSNDTSRALRMRILSYKILSGTRGSRDIGTAAALSSVARELYGLSRYSECRIIYEIALSRKIQYSDGLSCRCGGVVLDLAGIGSTYIKQRNYSIALKYLEKALVYNDNLTNYKDLPRAMRRIKRWTCQALLGRGLIIYAQPVVHDYISYVVSRYTGKQDAWHQELCEAEGLAEQLVGCNGRVLEVS